MMFLKLPVVVFLAPSHPCRAMPPRKEAVRGCPSPQSLAKDLVTTQKWLLELPWKLHILEEGKSFYAL